MGNYLVTAQVEVLYEKAYGILAKYDRYTSQTDCPLECVKDMEKSLAAYTKKIILCEDEKTLNDIKKNLNLYESIIDNVNSSLYVGA